MEKMKSIPPHADTTLLKVLNECSDILGDAVNAHTKMEGVFEMMAGDYLDPVDTEKAWAWDRERIQTLLEVVRDYMYTARDAVDKANEIADVLAKKERARLIGE